MTVSLISLLLASLGGSAWGVGSYLFGGSAIYSAAKLAGPPHFYVAASLPVVWWTGMTDYTSPDSLPQVFAWYQNSACAAGFGTPVRCELDHFKGWGFEFTRFVILQAGFNNTTSVRLVTMISLWI